MKRICIFCGSSHGMAPAYDRAAHEIGVALAERGLGLVYGGGNVGLMGVIADAVLGRGGKAVGVIPQALVDKELAHQGLTELHIVHSMHERKALMAELADAFIALPGGYGTLEEFCEIITWTQLGLHKKPCGLLNVEGFYDPFLAQVDHAVKAGFIRKENRSLILVGTEPRPLIDRLLQSRPPTVPKWIALDET
jgi:uncharacterized protein (TIGR00730 family)